jgi:hypothetical protein
MKYKFQITNSKLQIFFLFIFCYLVFSASAHAATPSTTPPPTAIQDKLINQINDLKEKIASKVAQLKLVDKRSVIGTVVEKTNTQITINDMHDQTRFIDVDEITKFSGPDSTASFGISDVTPGTHISVLGLYNKESRRITARFIETVTPTHFISGTVLSLNKDAGTFKVIAEDGKTTTVDVENITKTSTYTKDGGLEKAGFSKLTAGARVTLSGYPDKKDKTMIIATRLIIFLDLPKNPKIIIPDGGVVDNGASPVTSSGSGKKLTPIK